MQSRKIAIKTNSNILLAIAMLTVSTQLALGDELVTSKVEGTSTNRDSLVNAGKNANISSSTNISTSTNISAGSNRKIAAGNIPPERSPAATQNLSRSARELSDLSGITPILQTLEQEQSSPSLPTLSLEALAKRQKLIYLREKLNSTVSSANLQINSTRGKVDAAVAKADELRAYITERRNRMTHRNSQVNLLSGGVTKIVGYSLALSPITDIPTNVLEVFDGSVQTSLTAFALRQEREEAKMEHGMPSILESFLTGRDAAAHFPPSVWNYLNNDSPGEPGIKSRRQILIDGWQKSGVLAKARVDGPQTRLKRNVTIELLDQRLAMLSDLKSAISEMHNGLMELNDAIVLSYAADPTM